MLQMLRTLLINGELIHAGNERSPDAANVGASEEMNTV